jgi:hypothetical protein
MNSYSAHSLASEKQDFLTLPGALPFVRVRQGNGMRSLESTYNGVRFRSRLEARWAALFDSYSIKWVYEPDVFYTCNGSYLPDFYLTEMHCYVEVKPRPGMADADQCKAVADQTGASFLILDSPALECRAYPLYEWFGDEGAWSDTAWCMSEKYLGIRPNDIRHRFYICTGVLHSDSTHSEPCPGCPDYHPDTIERFTKYRSMRFEKGVARSHR